MNWKWLTLLSVLTLSVQSAEPTFFGVLVSGGDVHVVLINPDSGRSSGWIRIGQKFEGYTVKRYESFAEKLVVEFENQERVLPLVSGSYGSYAGRARLAVTIKDIPFQIFAATRETKEGRLVFRGVTGLSPKVNFTCEELIVDVKDDQMMLIGNVKVHQRGEWTTYPMVVKI